MLLEILKELLAYMRRRPKGSKKRKCFPGESGENNALLGLHGNQLLLHHHRQVAVLSCQTYGLLHKLNELFSVLFNIDTDCVSVLKYAAALSSKYPDDLDKDFGEELIQFKTFIQEEWTLITLQPPERHGLQTMFPSVFVALRIFLTVPVTNAEGQRLFSRLKQVKNELRTTMTQKRLTALSLLTTESELVKEIDSGNIVDTFARVKSRKKFC